MSEFISPIAPLIRAFVAFRKASRRWNEASYEVNLSLFAKYCDKHFPNVSELSQDMVDSWCAQRETEANNSCRSRIYPVVSFIRYLRKRGMTVVTEPTVPRKEPRDYIPHAFTEAELQNFFKACDSISADPPTEEQLSRRIVTGHFIWNWIPPRYHLIWNQIQKEKKEYSKRQQGNPLLFWYII
jgi:hypothetical protein